MTEKIITVEDITDGVDYNGKDYKRIMSTEGLFYNIKQGQGGKLKEKWGLLKEGSTIKLIMGTFKKGNQSFQFVKDIEAVEQSEAPAKSSKEASIEAQVAVKAVVDLWIADKLPENCREIVLLRKLLIKWLLSRLGDGEEIEDEENLEGQLPKALRDGTQPATPSQVNKVARLSKALPGRASALIKEWGWKAVKPVDLTRDQAKHLIEVLEKELKEKEGNNADNQDSGE